MASPHLQPASTAHLCRCSARGQPPPRHWRPQHCVGGRASRGEPQSCWRCCLMGSAGWWQHSECRRRSSGGLRPSATACAGCAWHLHALKLQAAPTLWCDCVARRRRPIRQPSATAHRRRVAPPDKKVPGQQGHEDHKASQDYQGFKHRAATQPLTQPLPPAQQPGWVAHRWRGSGGGGAAAGGMRDTLMNSSRMDSISVD